MGVYAGGDTSSMVYLKIFGRSEERRGRRNVDVRSYIVDIRANKELNTGHRRYSGIQRRMGVPYGAPKVGAENIQNCDLRGFFEEKGS